jgi:MraZ protein
MATTRNDNARPPIGTEYRAVDEKGRLMIPARWRVGLGRELYVVPSTQGGLFLLSKTQFEELRRARSDIEASEEEKEDFIRYLEYNSELAALDGQGRINLNEALLHRGSISTGAEVVLKLRRRGIEVFNKQRWSQVQESHRPAFDKVGRKYGL